MQTTEHPKADTRDMPADPKQQPSPGASAARPAPDAQANGDEERDDTVIAVAFEYSLIVIGVLLLIAGGVYAWRSFPRPQVVVEAEAPELPAVRALPPVELPRILFQDVTDASGIDFIHENGAYGDKLLPETMGGGCAFLDYDADGDADILFVNSMRWPWDPRPAPRQPATLALYENDGQGKYANVTAQAGLDVPVYGQGCAVGDFDNDGDQDIFISGVGLNETIEGGGSAPRGPHRLLRNDGGRFTDVTAASGVEGRPGDWGSSCGWFDYDNDGDLDLWVCNYVVWSKQFDLAQAFQLVGGGRAYGRPQDFGGTYNQLFRNEGGGTFADVSDDAGLNVNDPARGTPMAKSLGLCFADFDADGRLDVIVANDTVQNFLFHNQPDGTFLEIGAAAGIAFDAKGRARGAMGIDVGCARNEAECFAVAIGNFSNEMTAFYVSIPGQLQFTDEAVANGVGPNSRLQLKFGVFFFDADLDGRLDLFEANGHLEDEIAKVQNSQTYEQPPHLFWNAGARNATEFVPLTAAQCGAEFFRPIVGRGAAYADIDGDGDLDVLIAATGQKPRLLRNDQHLGHHWARFKLVGNGSTSNRDAIGARIDLHLEDDVLTQFVMPTRSYQSQVEQVVTFGLGQRDRIERVEITWPDGTRQTIGGPAIDRLHEIEQAAPR